MNINHLITIHLINTKTIQSFDHAYINSWANPVMDPRLEQRLHPPTNATQCPSVQLPATTGLYQRSPVRFPDSSQLFRCPVETRTQIGNHVHIQRCSDSLMLMQINVCHRPGDMQRKTERAGLPPPVRNTPSFTTSWFSFIFRARCFICYQCA